MNYQSAHDRVLEVKRLYKSIFLVCHLFTGYRFQEFLQNRRTYFTEYRRIFHPYHLGDYHCSQSCEAVYF